MLQWRRWVIIVSSLVIAVTLLVIAIASADVRLWLPIAISLTSLSISVVSAFRGELFPFNVKVLPGGVFTARHSDLSHLDKDSNEVDLVLPLVFLNTGHGEGVIEGLAVKVSSDSDTVMLYRPVAEIELKSFIQARAFDSQQGEHHWAIYAFSFACKTVVTKSMAFLSGDWRKSLPANCFVSRHL